MVRHSHSKITYAQTPAQLKNAIAEGNPGYSSKPRSPETTLDPIIALHQIDTITRKIINSKVDYKRGAHRALHIMRKCLPIQYAKLTLLHDYIEHVLFAKDGKISKNIETYVTHTGMLALKEHRQIAKSGIIQHVSVISLPLLSKEECIGILSLVFTTDDIAITHQYFLDLVAPNFAQILSSLLTGPAIDKNELLNSLIEGIIVRDMNDAVVYYNRIALESAQNRDEIIAQRKKGNIVTPHWDTFDANGDTLQGENVPSIYATHTGKIIQGALYGLKPDPEIDPDRIIPILVSASPLLNKAGNRIGSVVVFHDFSIVRHNEQIIIEYLKREIHSVNGNLTTINLRLGSMWNIVQRLSVDETIRNQYTVHNDVVTQQIEKISATIHFLISTEIPALGIKTRFSLTQKVLEIMREVRKSSQCEISCLGDSSNTDLPIYASISDIKTVIRHLIDNAIKYSDENTPIELSLYKGSYKDHEMAFFSIRDYGYGVDKNLVPVLFKKYMRAMVSKPDGTLIPGTGFGLFDCSNIINGVGGKMMYDPAPDGIGSIFSFRIPIAPNF